MENKFNYMRVSNYRAKQAKPMFTAELPTPRFRHPVFSAFGGFVMFAGLVSIAATIAIVWLAFHTVCTVNALPADQVQFFSAPLTVPAAPAVDLDSLAKGF